MDFKFNVDKIVYFTEKERDEYAQKNQLFIDELNSGAKFGLKSEVVEVWGDGEPHDPYYDFVVLPSGARLPLPLFSQAAGLVLPEEATAEGLIDLLKQFGDQFVGRVDKVGDFSLI